MTLRGGVLMPTSATQAQQGLFVIRNADMATTADQAFTKLFAGAGYVVTGIVAVRKTGAFSVACLGGIYTAASKGGVALLSAAQSWATLTGAGAAAVPLVANLLQTITSSATPILSLTTANLAALTADIFILGAVID